MQSFLGNMALTLQVPTSRPWCAWSLQWQQAKGPCGVSAGHHFSKIPILVPTPRTFKAESPAARAWCLCPARVQGDTLHAMELALALEKLNFSMLFELCILYQHPGPFGQAVLRRMRAVAHVSRMCRATRCMPWSLH